MPQNVRLPVTRRKKVGLSKRESYRELVLILDLKSLVTPKSTDCLWKWWVNTMRDALKGPRTGEP